MMVRPHQRRLGIFAWVSRDRLTWWDEFQHSNVVEGSGAGHSLRSPDALEHDLPAITGESEIVSGFQAELLARRRGDGGATAAVH